MRLGLVGASNGDHGALARALRTAAQLAERVVYLGSDGDFDLVIDAWLGLIGADASLRRRAEAVLDAGPETILEAVRVERARSALSRMVALAGPGCRSVEILGDRVVLLADDKADLDKEDLLPASFIAFGRGEPLVRRVGSRVFVSPGPPSSKAGVALLDMTDANGFHGAPTLSLTLLAADGAETHHEQIELGRTVKLRVQGATG